MATMAITVTVQSGSFVWTRSASVTDIDVVGNTSGDTSFKVMASSEGVTSPGIGLHSYDGTAVLIIANKSKGSLTRLRMNNASDAPIAGFLIPQWLPLILYSSSGGGFTGAAKFTATSTDLPDQDIASVQAVRYMGGLDVQLLYGLKLIS